MKKTWILNGLLIAALLSLVVYVWRDHPPLPIDKFSVETFKLALSRHDVESVQYLASSQQLTGRIRSHHRDLYGGDEFRLNEPLSLELYQEILSQQLTTQKFLGPLAGLQTNPEFDQQLAIQPAPTGSVLPEFAAGETSVYSLRALGMSLGELRLSVLSPIMVQKQLSYQFQVRAQTSSAYASFYRVEDEAESYVRAKDFVPLGFLLSIDESERYGSHHEAYQASHVDSWLSLVTRQAGLQQKKSTLVREAKWHNFVSALFDLRRRNWTQMQTLFITDQGKQIVIRAKSKRLEEISSALGRIRAYVIEPTIEIDGKAQSKVKIQFWIQESKPHVLLKIEADVKIGRVIAELKNYVAKMQE